MLFEIQQQQKEKIEASGKIPYKEICDILEAFQIASGQSFAIGKTKALLEYLKNGNSFVIENFDHSNINKEISSISQLINMYKSIDQHIDITTDKDFNSYFI